MKIGILGAPGAGKSKFAKALAKELGDTKVVDNYVQRHQTASGRALGPWATYSENFMIAGLRQAAEDRVDTRVTANENTITVGTIVDTLTYAAIKSDYDIHAREQSKREAAMLAAEAAMRALSLWYTETWDYNIAFYLPLDERVELADELRWTRALDEAYQPVLESFYVPGAFGLQGNPKERVKIAIETIQVAQVAAKSQAEVEAAAFD